MQSKPLHPESTPVTAQAKPIKTKPRTLWEVVGIILIILIICVVIVLILISLEPQWLKELIAFQGSN